MGRFDDDDKYRSRDDDRDRHRDRDRDRDRDRSKRSRSRGARRSRSRDRGRDKGRDTEMAAEDSTGGEIDVGHRRHRSESTNSWAERERARTRRENRKTGWDVLPADGMIQSMPTVQSMKNAGAIAPNDISAASFGRIGNKRCREVWVGNLLQGAVSPQHLKDFFTQMFNALPEFQEKYAQLIKEGKSAVRDIQMANDGPYHATFGFVEFWTEELAGTALEFNGVEFMGRPMKTGRPSGFVAMGKLADPLDVDPLRKAGLLPQQAQKSIGYQPHAGNAGAEAAALAMNPVGGGMMPAGGLSNNLILRRQRELYFGNLPQGQLTAESIKQLLTPACELLPDFEKDGGPPIVNVNMQNPEQAKFCFVEFQNDKLASSAIPIFNGMEIFGRKMVVARPTGYVDPEMPSVAPEGMGAVAQFSAAQLKSQNPELAGRPAPIMGMGDGSGPPGPVSGNMAAGALAAAAMLSGE